MIITVTPNPAIDRTFQLNELAVGEINRSIATQVDAGGKGINISRALQAQGNATVSVFPAAGNSGIELVNTLKHLGVPTNPVYLDGETRSNITLVGNAGVTTKINAPGPVLTHDDEAALLKAVRETVDSIIAKRSVPDGAVAPDGQHITIVGAGSLPNGTDPNFYVKLAQLGADLGVDVALDTSGAPLAHAVKAGGFAVVKPNEAELTELVGQPLKSVGDAVATARSIIKLGTKSVLLSLGENGALLITSETWAWAGGQSLIPTSTVGAGDVTLAGFLAAQFSYTGQFSDATQFSETAQSSGSATLSGSMTPQHRPIAPSPTEHSPEFQALKTAVAWGRAAVLQPGTAVPTPKDINLTAVTLIAEPDYSIKLTEVTSLLEMMIT